MLVGGALIGSFLFHSTLVHSFKDKVTQRVTDSLELKYSRQAIQQQQKYTEALKSRLDQYNSDLTSFTEKQQALYEDRLKREKAKIVSEYESELLLREVENEVNKVVLECSTLDPDIVRLLNQTRSIVKTDTSK